MVAELVELVPGCGTNLVLVLLLVGCVADKTHWYGSSDPTLAKPGNGCGGTAGSRVVESSEWDCTLLDGGFDGHEKCGGRSCLGEFTRKCLREFWKEQGPRNRVLVLRETKKIRMSQEADGPRHVTVEGFEDGRQQRKEQARAQVQTSQVRQVWSGHEVQKRACSKQASTW